MGVYRKKGTRFFWMSYQDAAGKWRDDSTGCEVEADAESVYVATVEAIENGDLPPEFGPKTVKSYSETWLKERRERGLDSVDDDDAKLRDHILPPLVVHDNGKRVIPGLGSELLSDLTPKRIQEWLRALKKKRSSRTGDLLAPRTVLHIVGALNSLCNDAIADGHLQANPCVFKKGDLPKKRDKDAAWRATAIFSRSEVERLISDPTIPDDELVWHAIHFLGGLRPGEGSALRVRDYDQAARPLHRFVVSKAWDRRRKRIKGTKTEIPRDVPVHPVLAKILARWLLSGWQRMMGRPPRPDDLLVPSRPLPYQIRQPGYAPKPRGNSVSLKQFHRTLERLGLKVEGPKPWRRFYDARRTFISLALADGALKDVFCWVTHPANEDQMDEYTSISYAAKCAEVAKLRVELREGQLVALPVAVGANLTTALTTDAEAGKKNPANIAACGAETGGVYGTRSCVESATNALGSNRHNADSHTCDVLESTDRSVERNLRGSACSDCSGPYRLPKLRSEPASAVVVLRASAKASRRGGR